MHLSDHIRRPVKREKISWGAVLLTCSVMMINFLPLYYFVSVSPAVKFAISTTGIFISFIIALKSGIVDGMSDRVFPYASYIIYYLWVVVSIVFMGDYVDDPLTIVGLLIMQPAIVLASIMLREHKSSFVNTVRLLSFVFFVFVAVNHSLFGRGISIGNDLDMSYQTINVYLGMLVILNVTRKKRGLVDMLFTSVMVVYSIYLMLVAGGRSPVLSVILICLFFYIFMYRSVSGRVTVAVVALLSVVALGPWIAEIVGETLVFKRTTMALQSEDSTSRMFLFGSAIELFKQSPIIGSGVNSFPVFIGKFEEGWYPHNIFLEIAASLGLMGLIPFLSYVVYVISVFFGSHAKWDSHNIQSMCLFLYILVIYQFSGDMVAAWLFYLVLGMALPSVHLKRNPRRVLRSLHHHDPYPRSLA